jgi:NhaA family Na+:H+ antiporter
VAAVLLVIAAALGLLIANSPVGPAVIAAFNAHPATGFPVIDLSPGHWITDGLLAIFFFLAAIELRHELTHGELDSPRKALAPAVAAVGGVIVPALLFLLVVREPGLNDGWPIPTATDIAFALGVLALVGRGLPPRIRAFLLALAVIDDLIAILFIALFFTEDLAPIPLLLAIPAVLLFGWLSYRIRGRGAPWVVVALAILAPTAWVLVLLSGVHPTIAGVALGLAFAPAPAQRVRHALEPWTNAVILPVFAFTASLVAFPAVSAGDLSPVFWGILIALPVGKLVGITAGALLAGRLVPASERRAGLHLPDILVVASLGGIGFTVSLLMNELAFEKLEDIAAQGTIAVLCGSLIAALVGGAITAARASTTRRRSLTSDQ